MEERMIHRWTPWAVLVAALAPGLFAQVMAVSGPVTRESVGLPPEFSDSGAESDLPPGTISIAYDDKMHTKSTKYSFPGEGTMEIVVTLDENGNTIGYTLQTGGTQQVSSLECEYDRVGNWTSCRQIVEGNGQRFTKEAFRRTITYRE
jgi:hypothetical protein